MEAIVAAFAFFTRLPVDRGWDADDPILRRAAVHAPLVGIAVGAVAGAVFVVARPWTSDAVAAVLCVAASAALTGALHEDGLADYFDGVGVGGGRERVLAVMREPTIGAFGVLGLVLVLLGRVTGIAALAGAVSSPWVVVAVLVAAHATSRLAAVSIMSSLPYASAGESTRSAALVAELGIPGLLVAATWGAAPLLGLGAAGRPALALAVVPVLLVRGWVVADLRRRLRGYTGDGLGAVQQLGECAFYLAACALAAATA